MKRRVSGMMTCWSRKGRGARRLFLFISADHRWSEMIQQRNWMVHQLGGQAGSPGSPGSSSAGNPAATVTSVCSLWRNEVEFSVMRVKHGKHVKPVSTDGGKRCQTL